MDVDQISKCKMKRKNESLWARSHFSIELATVIETSEWGGLTI